MLKISLRNLKNVHYGTTTLKKNVFFIQNNRLAVFKEEFG